jgi:YVTN family beta-propeller protein
VSNTVSVLDTATNAVLTTVTVGAVPQAVAVHPLLARAYVANTRSDNVSVIDTGSNGVVAVIAVGSEPTGIAVRR